MVRKLLLKKKVKPTKFGPVSAIATAPVAIGNSIRGSKPSAVVTADGAHVRGRDFAFQVGSSVAAATDWTLVGGIPLTPAVMPATALKSYAQMYGMFRFNSIAVHYITSSATSQTGDIMFYYERDREGPGIDPTNSSFLPFVLSDSNTVLGPQWANHTALVKPDPEFKSTNYGLNIDLNEEVNGTVFIYSKTSAANSPGYVLFDYDITFRQLQANPRAGLLPVARGQWNQVCFGGTNIVTVAGTTGFSADIQGKTIAGVNAAAPTGAANGDIYKFVADLTNSTVAGVNAAWTNVSSVNLMQQFAANENIAVTLDDGFTCYVAYSQGNSPAWTFYSTYEQARAITAYGMHYGITNTVTWNLCGYLSLVGSINSRLQTSY